MVEDDEIDEEMYVQLIYDEIVGSFLTPLVCYVLANKVIDERFERDKTIVYSGIIIGLIAGLLSAFIIELMNSITDSVTMAVLGIALIVTLILGYSWPYLSNRMRHDITKKAAIRIAPEVVESVKGAITKEQEEQLKTKIRSIRSDV
jgi:hypothetical protein